MATRSRSGETTEAIMRATYQALCKHGYPDTTISSIADEFDKSKGLLYYHYENKDDLLTDFLRYLLERLDSEIGSQTDADPDERLLALVDQILPPEMSDDEIRFRQAFFEIRSQAPHSDAYHDLIQQHDDLLYTELRDTIERGVDADRFQPVDPDQSAEFLLSMIHGVMERGVTLEDRELLRRNREQLRSYIEREIFAASSETA